MMKSLTVTVLRAKNNQSHDYWSESDCYVIVRLPTASARSHRTKTVPNSKTPEWNESFHFRVHRHVKNIVELTMYDEDSIMSDDLCSIVVFDISNLTPGKKETKTFLSEPTTNELWVEFELLESKEHAGDYLSNGVLVASTFSTVDVNVEKLMTTASEYYCVMSVTDSFWRRPCSQQLRHKSVCILKLEIVPVIAVVGSGGGTRAMTGLYGSLKGLQRLGLLDAMSYITGVSGSTWALATLYQEADWSQCDMDESISAMEGEITKSFLSAFTPEKLQYYRHQMAEKEKEGHMVSLIDMWGLVIEHCLYGKKNTSTLFDQQKAVSEGQNPLPICTAVNLKDGVKDTTRELEWCEFTPYEVGIPKYGAYIHAEDFGSEFYLGHLVKKHPAIRTSYLLGLWSSVFSLNLTQLWRFATGGQPSWSPWLGEDVNKIETDNEPTTLDTYLFKPVTNTASALTSFFTTRPVITQIYNFMRGFFLHWNYNDNSNFTAWKDMHPDAFPNRLTPADSTLHLADSGFSINTGCPPVLRPERAVDVIMSLNYSWCEDQFEVLKRTEVYCKDHSIPFPRIDFSSLKGQPLKELYIFEDEKNPKAPTVLHFPFVNISFKEFKAPGVARKGKEEMMAGDVDVSTSSSPYLTKHLTYAAKDFRALTDLTSYNIQNNKEKILQALGKVLERKVPVEE
ncbi:cytosolic phospholipase A2 zeta-like [Oncorhynchus clarkii lewisi]|uniref:cytosolic phospholipase A2 zeta-like n=1 Tax=Oncorhynchus clarkii lewisi TaxID=490388 RepID=UPI0039B8F38A